MIFIKLFYVLHGNWMVKIFSFSKVNLIIYKLENHLFYLFYIY